MKTARAIRSSTFRKTNGPKNHWFRKGRISWVFRQLGMVLGYWRAFHSQKTNLSRCSVRNGSTRKMLDDLSHAANKPKPPAPSAATPAPTSAAKSATGNDRKAKHRDDRTP